MTHDDTLSPGLRVEPGVDFPLPPAELAEELRNDPPGAAPPAAPARSAERKATRLAFIGVEPAVTVPLQYPFALDGAEIREIVVRALAVEATGAVVSAIGEEKLSVYDFYAEMTGLPAEVIRALPGVDGERVTRAGYDFLPRFMKGPGAG